MKVTLAMVAIQFLIRCFPCTQHKLVGITIMYLYMASRYFSRKELAKEELKAVYEWCLQIFNAWVMYACVATHADKPCC